MVEASLWVLWAWVVGITSIFLLIGVFVHYGVLEENSPGWLGAVGSLGAVFAAVFIASHQSREQAKVRRSKERVVEVVVTELAERASMVASDLFQSFEIMRRGTTTSQRELLVRSEYYLSAIQGISLAELPRPEMVEPFLIIRGSLEQSILQARLLIESKEIDSLRGLIILNESSNAIREALGRLRMKPSS